MNAVLAGRREDIAAATMSICDALERLTRLRDAMTEHLATLPHGHPDERVAFALSRVCSRLAHATTELPSELWLAMSASDDVGTSEVIARFNRLLTIPLVAGAPA